MVAAGRLRVMFESEVENIESDVVVLKTAQGHTTIPNDAVLVCAGGILPDGLLRETGIEIETKYGTL